MSAFLETRSPRSKRALPRYPRTDTWAMGTRMIVSVAVLALVTAHIAPAESQSTAPYELREGLWVGESIAWVELGGSAEGSSATFDGVLTTEFTMFVDEIGLVDGDWVLDGDAIMLLSGSVSGDIVFDYSGEGTLTGTEVILVVLATVTY